MDNPNILYWPMQLVRLAASRMAWSPQSKSVPSRKKTTRMTMAFRNLDIVRGLRLGSLAVFYRRPRRSTTRRESSLTRPLGGSP